MKSWSLIRKTVASTTERKSREIIISQQPNKQSNNIIDPNIKDDNPGAKWKIGDKPLIGSYFFTEHYYLCVFSIAS